MKNAKLTHDQVKTALIACLGVLFVFPQTGWTQYFQLKTLAQFDGTNGSSPSALTLGNDGTFYGTTYSGSDTNAPGTIFKITTNGTLTTIARFATNSGANPYAALTWGPDGLLYGTTEYGGLNGGGTVFKATTNGDLTTLASFNLIGGKWVNGENPKSSLTLGADGLFYGTTLNGGTNDRGAIFSVAPASGTLTGLKSLSSAFGSSPNANLTPGPDGIFWGTTTFGGTYNKGTVFSYSTDGTLTSLTNFNGANGDTPNAGLTLGNDGFLYGTTAQGGAYLKGTIFRVTTNGNLTTLTSLNLTNGANPGSALTLGNDGFLYGTTSQGGDTNFNIGQGLGTVFRVSTNGSLTKLIDFNGTDGSFANAALTLGNDGSFYGTTTQGGTFDKGTVFVLIPLPPPPLNISLQSNAVILSWTNMVYGLQSAPEITGVFTNLNGVLSPYTSSITGDHQFFRLIAN